MASHDLFAVNTKFRKGLQSPVTYLHVVTQDTPEVNDQYVDREVNTEWRGKEYLVKVMKNFGGQYGERQWKVRFTDGFIETYGEEVLKKS